MMLEKEQKSKIFYHIKIMQFGFAWISCLLTKLRARQVMHTKMELPQYSKTIYLG